MSNDRTVKSAFLEKPGGRRKAVRPELRWLDYIKYGRKPMGVKRWRKTAEYRFV
jgi:hypothetical protein